MTKSKDKCDQCLKGGEDGNGNVCTNCDGNEYTTPTLPPEIEKEKSWAVVKHIAELANKHCPDLGEKHDATPAIEVIKQFLAEKLAEKKIRDYPIFLTDADAQRIKAERQRIIEILEGMNISEGKLFLLKEDKLDRHALQNRAYNTGLTQAIKEINK